MILITCYKKKRRLRFFGKFGRLSFTHADGLRWIEIGGSNPHILTYMSRDEVYAEKPHLQKLASLKGMI